MPRSLSNAAPSLAWIAPTRLILIRHGQTEATANGRFCGRLDVPLSASGLQQARDVARWLKGVPVAAIYTSPLKRARDTAEVIAAWRKLPVTALDDLSEIDFGDFDGMTFEEAWQRWPQLYEVYLAAPTAIQFPNGESLSLLKRRVARAIDLITRTHTGKIVVVVAHAGVNRLVVAEALGLPLEQLFRLDQRPAAINVVDYFEQTTVVRLMNGRARDDAGRKLSGDRPVLG
jgi:alpha-ribazole phosphatase